MRLFGRIGVALRSAFSTTPWQSGVQVRRGVFNYDHVTELRGRKRFQMFSKMEGDPFVDEALSSVRDPLVTGRWEYVAASDRPADREAAEFANAVLLRRYSERYGPEYWTQTSWEGQRLQEILDFQRVGFSLFSYSFRRVGTKLVWDRVTWLEPESLDPIDGWTIDEDTDSLLAVRRTYVTPSGKQKTVTIEAHNLALYVHGPRGARFEGRPLLRAMFGAWKQKDWLIREEMQWARKVGSPPPIVTYPDNADTADAAKIEDFARGLAMSEIVDAFLASKRGADGKGVEVSYPEASGQAQVDRMGTLIMRKNAEIAHAGRTKSRLLGETDSGSRALGSTQSADEDVSHRSVAKLVCEQEMHGYGNIEGIAERLISENFQGASCPVLTVSRIGPNEDRSTVRPLVQVWTSNLPRKLKRLVTERLGYRLSEADYLEIEEEQSRQPVLVDPQDPDPDPHDPNDPDDPDQDDPDEEEVAASLAAFERRIDELLHASDARPASGGRAPTVLEDRYVDLAAVQEAYRVGVRDLLAELREIRAGMTEDLLRRLRAGEIQPETLDAQMASRYEKAKEAQKKLRRIMSEIAERGREHARQEADRMRS